MTREADFPRTHGDTADELSMFELHLLIAVGQADGSPNGVAVKEYLERSGYGQIHHGRLYPNMDDLVEKGFIVKTQKDRRTNAYSLTIEGLDKLHAFFDWTESGTLTM